MNLNKQIEALVLAYLSSTEALLTREECELLVNNGYMDLAGNPTHKSLKYYLDKFVVGKTKLPLVSQLQIDSSLNGVMDLDVLFTKVVRLLGSVPKSAGFIATHDKSYYIHGISNILDHKPYHDIKDIKKILTLLDKPEELISIIESEFSLNPLVIKFHSEETKELSPESVLIGRYFYLNDGEFLKSGYIGLLSPKRSSYDDAISLIEYVGKTLETKVPHRGEGGFTGVLGQRKQKSGFSGLLSLFGSR